jgi:hypothetical protein
MQKGVTLKEFLLSESKNALEWQRKEPCGKQTEGENVYFTKNER